MNSSELVADIVRKAQLPSDEETLSNSDILDLATKELQTVVTPKILSVRENFLATYKDFTLSTSREYRIPQQATGSKLLAVEVIQGDSRPSLIMVGMMEIPSREGFYIRSGKVILSSNAPNTGTLRMHYAARPGKLSETYKYISSLDDDFTVQCSAPHLLSAGAILSIQKGTSPFEYAIQDAVVTAVGGNTITFAENLASLGVERGDVVTITAADPTVADANQESTAFYPNIPVELHDWLSYRVAIRVLEHLGHSDLMQQKMAKVADIEKDLLALISPRSDDAGKIIFEKELLGDYWV